MFWIGCNEYSKPQAEEKMTKNYLGRTVPLRLVTIHSSGRSFWCLCITLPLEQREKYQLDYTLCSNILRRIFTHISLKKSPENHVKRAERRLNFLYNLCEKRKRYRINQGQQLFGLSWLYPWLEDGWSMCYSNVSTVCYWQTYSNDGPSRKCVTFNQMFIVPALKLSFVAEKEAS